MAGELAQHMEGEPDIAVAPDGPMLQGEEAYRYRLKAPVFTGLEDVEQFIQEFSDVIDITQWPPKVALIRLRMALTEQAKPYGLGTSVDGIFATLRARFSISAIDARARLQGLCREPRMLLQEHAATVNRLAQIPYSDLPAIHQERYTYDAFMQSLNDLGLHHQLQARGVTTVEDALCEGEAYLLAKQLHKGHLSSQQVTVNSTEGYCELLPSTQVATTTVNSPLDAEVTRMTEMLEKLVAVLARSDTVGCVQRPMRSQTMPPRPPALCWGCGGREHIRT